MNSFYTQSCCVGTPLIGPQLSDVEDSMHATKVPCPSVSMTWRALLALGILGMQ